MAVARMDQGYAWVVTFACFVVCFIMAGMARAAGVLYVAIIELYGCSREAASAPFSIRYSVRNMAGPLIGVLGQRYGIGAITMAGGLLAGIGGALCALAPDIFWLTVFWGGIHGFGYGLCNLIHVMILNQYFDKYKGTALGLALSGDCFGTFAFPTILEMFIQNYGVNGTFLILGGIALNVIPAGMLMRAPDWEKSQTKRDASKVPIASETKGNWPGILNKAFVLESLTNEDKGNKDYIVNPHSSSYLQINDSLRIYNKHLPDETSNNKKSDIKNSFNDEYTRNSQPPLPNHLLPLAVVTPKIWVQTLKTEELIAIDSKTRSDSRTQMKVGDPNTLKTNFAKLPCDVAVDIKSKESSPGNHSERSAIVQFFITNTRPLFLLIALTLSGFQFLFISVITIIIDYALDKGISSEGAKYLVIGFSVADLIGRLGFGGVLDKQWIKPSHFAGLTTALMGISVLAIPVYSNFYYLMACMAFCGLVMGGNCIMYPILVEKYMDKKEQTMAMGSLNLYAGLLVFSLAPMIGFFRDSMGSYNGVFWSVGGLCSLSGFLWILEPHLWKLQQKMNN